MITHKDDIEITPVPRYLADQSSPKDNKYVNAYTITITNHGNESVQLVARRWLITDDKGRHQEVAGSGVVGETPHIAPGTSFTYTSGAIIATPSGQMEGAYQMIDAAGFEFEVAIPLFVLVPPHQLH